jgi:hypothetical protein
VGSSQQQWVLALTLTLVGTPRNRRFRLVHYV